MAISGIGKNVWQDVATPEGAECPPVGAGYEFEVVSVKEGQADSEKRGHHDYVSVGCVTYGDNDQKYWHYEYLALTTEGSGLGWAKKFLQGIGRADSMTEDFDWQDLVGTRFKGDVASLRESKTGRKNSNLDYDSLTGITHEYYEIVASSNKTPAAAAGRGRR